VFRASIGCEGLANADHKPANVLCLGEMALLSCACAAQRCDLCLVPMPLSHMNEKKKKSEDKTERIEMFC
jgi:hypothetical protein